VVKVLQKRRRFDLQRAKTLKAKTKGSAIESKYDETDTILEKKEENRCRFSNRLAPFLTVASSRDVFQRSAHGVTRFFLLLSGSRAVVVF